MRQVWQQFCRERKRTKHYCSFAWCACSNITFEEIDKAKNEIVGSSVFLAQLEINLDATCYGIDMAYRNNVPVVLNPAPYRSLDDSIFKKIAVLTPNETEAEMFSGIKTDTKEGIIKAAEYFRKKGVKTVIITLGKKGIYIF